MENKNLILAVVLSVALLWGYTTFIAPPPPKPGAPAAEQAKDKNGQAASPEAPAPAGAPAAPTALAPAPPPPPVQQAREIVVETPLAQYTFSERGGALRKVVLKNYYMEIGRAHV
jgi:YidC/Oxa1 family membrane protein insertase